MNTRVPSAGIPDRMWILFHKTTFMILVLFPVDGGDPLLGLGVGEDNLKQFLELVEESQPGSTEQYEVRWFKKIDEEQNDWSMLPREIDV